MAFAVLDFQKGTADNIAGISAHNNREYTPENSEPKRAHLNRHLIGDGQPIQNLVDDYLDKNYSATTTRKLKDGTIKEVPLKIRKDAVRSVNVVLSVGPEHFGHPADVANGKYDQAKLDKWIDANLEYLRKEFGDRCVSANLHLDEKTPHIHASVVPLQDGRLSAKKMFFGGKSILSKHHDRYHKYMKPLGIERGESASTTENAIKRARTELECRGQELKEVKKDIQTQRDQINKDYKTGNKHIKANETKLEELKKELKYTQDKQEFYESKCRIASVSAKKADEKATMMNQQADEVGQKLEKTILRASRAVTSAPHRFEQTIQKTASESLKMDNIAHSVIHDDSYSQRAFRMIQAVADFFDSALNHITEFTKKRKEKSNIRTFTKIEELTKDSPIQENKQSHRPNGRTM